MHADARQNDGDTLQRAVIGHPSAAAESEQAPLVRAWGEEGAPGDAQGAGIAW